MLKYNRSFYFVCHHNVCPLKSMCNSSFLKRKHGKLQYPIEYEHIIFKLLMDILTIYYQYSIRRLTWDIKKLKQNIFFTYQPYLAIQWSSIHEIIRGRMRVVDRKNVVACANYDVQKFWCLEGIVSPCLGQVPVSKV